MTTSPWANWPPTARCVSLCDSAVWWSRFPPYGGLAPSPPCCRLYPGGATYRITLTPPAGASPCGWARTHRSAGIGGPPGPRIGYSSVHRSLPTKLGRTVAEARPWLSASGGCCRGSPPLGLARSMGGRMHGPCGQPDSVILRDASNNSAPSRASTSGRPSLSTRHGMEISNGCSATHKRPRVQSPVKR